MVLYDVLESFDNGGNSWKGKLVNIDLTQPKSKGINPIVYYSTKKDINLYEKGKSIIDMELPKDSDITNSEIWSTTPPNDMPEVTAIAIDLTTDTEGKSYTLTSEESVNVILTMQAPIENYKTLIETNSKAKNSAWWLGTTQQLNEPEHINFSVYEWTEIGIREPKIGIEKSSTIESGTKENPKIVKIGDRIVYDISVINGSEYESLLDVMVRESLPKGIEVLFDDMEYYYDNDADNAKLIKDSEAIHYEIDGENLDFKINQVLSNQVLHLIIPVRVKLGHDDVLRNTAVITGYNGFSYTLSSNTTYHKIYRIDNPETGSFIITFLITMSVLLLISGLMNVKKKFYKI